MSKVELLGPSGTPEPNEWQRWGSRSRACWWPGGRTWACLCAATASPGAIPTGRRSAVRHARRPGRPRPGADRGQERVGPHRRLARRARPRTTSVRATAAGLPPRAERVLFVALLGGRLEYRELERDDGIADIVERTTTGGTGTSWSRRSCRRRSTMPTAGRCCGARRQGERVIREATADEEAAAADCSRLRERIGELEAEAEATPPPPRRAGRRRRTSRARHSRRAATRATTAPRPPHPTRPLFTVRGSRREG